MASSYLLQSWLWFVPQSSSQGDARIFQFLLRFDVKDMLAVVAECVPPELKFLGTWLGAPASLIGATLDTSKFDGLSWQDVAAVVRAIRAVMEPLSDVHEFLSYFLLSLSSPSTLFRQYMDIQLGRGSDSTAPDAKRLHLRDGSLLTAIQEVRTKLHVLARADVIPKADLQLIAKMLANSNVQQDVEVLNGFFRDGSSRTECRLAPDVRLNVLRRVIRQMQVLDLVNSMTAGLEKHELGQLMKQASDPMPEELLKLKSYLEEDRDNVTLTLVKADSRYIEIFQGLTPVQMDLLRNCGKYADFKRWLRDLRFFDEPGSQDGTERFNKMINYVTQLLQGESYDEEVLTALMDSRPVMTLFKEPASLTDLVRSVGECTLPSVQKLDLVQKNLTQIQDWFDDNVSHTYGEIIGQLNAIMEAGKAIIKPPSKLAGGNRHVSLEIKFSITKHSRAVERSLTEEQLADFAQAVIFHASERDDGHSTQRAQTDMVDEGDAVAAPAQQRQHATVELFLEAIDVLRQVRKVASLLFTEVHVTALKDSQELPVQDVASNRQLLDAFQTDLDTQRQELHVSSGLVPIIVVSVWCCGFRCCHRESVWSLVAERLQAPPAAVTPAPPPDAAVPGAPAVVPDALHVPRQPSHCDTHFRAPARDPDASGVLWPKCAGCRADGRAVHGRHVLRRERHQAGTYGSLGRVVGDRAGHAGLHQSAGAR